MTSQKNIDKFLNGEDDAPIYDHPEDSGLAITLTFGDVAENHAGMEKIGTPAKKGISAQELGSAFSKAEQLLSESTVEEASVELYDLSSELLENVEDEEKEELEEQEAQILVIRNGIDLLLGDRASHLLFKEMAMYPYDKKAKMKGRVVNKRARWNNCFADFSQDPDYEEGKGTVVDFENTKLVAQLREAWPKLLGSKAKGLVAETNLYYEVKDNYIGFHGDSERKIAVGARVGEEFPLYFQWHKGAEKVGKAMELKLGNGDLYIMSEKAVGADWKKRKIYTLRHAAGYAKTLKLQKKEITPLAPIKSSKGEEEKKGAKKEISSKKEEKATSSKKEKEEEKAKVKKDKSSKKEESAEEEEEEEKVGVKKVIPAPPKKVSPRSIPPKSAVKSLSPRSVAKKQVSFRRFDTVSAEDGICVAIKKDNSRCSNKAKYGNLCGVHSKPEAAKVDDGICVAIKKDNVRCSNKAKYGNLCGVHNK